MNIEFLSGPGVVFFQVLTYALVVGALAMIIHALARRADRWQHPWMRYVWVFIGVAWITSFVFALIWRTTTTTTIVGVMFVVVLVTLVAYLLRVVFPARAVERISAEAPEPEPVRNATFISETTPEEQSPDA